MKEIPMTNKPEEKAGERKMDFKSQRLAIAEACGLNPKMKTRSVYCDDPMEPSTIDVTEIIGKFGEVPEYPTDLNAMHNAEVMLREKYAEAIWSRYIDNLISICKFPETPPYVPSVKDIITWAIHATAEQRAEAFLKAIGKWSAK